MLLYLCQTEIKDFACRREKKRHEKIEREGEREKPYNKKIIIISAPVTKKKERMKTGGRREQNTH